MKNNRGKLYFAMILLLVLVGFPRAMAEAQSKMPAETPPYGGGFDTRRIPVELQAWWFPNFGHIHAAALLPLGQTVSGTLNFDVRIVLHDNPSRLTELRIDTELSVFLRIPLNLSCPYDGTASTNCAFNVPVSFDTTKLPNGFREMRIRATTQTPDGIKYLNSSGIPLNVQNGGGGGSDYNRWCNNTSLIGRAWYEGFGYTNAVIECVPLQPVSGQHTFRVRAQKDSGHLTVALDKTHFIPAVGSWPVVNARPGKILFDQDGDFQSFFPIAIDTTTLEDGWHSLAVQSTNPAGGTSSCSYCKGEINHPSGVAKIWFYVQNGPGGGGGDTTAPVITGAGASNITSSGARIDWTTDEPSDSKVEYGLTPSLGSVATGSGSVTSHSVTLSGLQAGTRYYYRASSTDAAGNTGFSPVGTFDTLALPVVGDTTKPVVSFSSPPAAKVTRTLTLSLAAQDNVDVVRVEVWVDDQKIGEFSPSAIQSLVLDVSGFTEGSHTITVKAFDAAGNSGSVSQVVVFEPIV